MKCKVCKATSYNPMGMGSFGKADNMLFKQMNFPNEYERGTDIYYSADSDRLLGWDYEGFRKTLQDHIHTGEMGIGDWVLGASDDEIMSFLKEALKVGEHYPGVDFTGYRVTGTVNRSNGYPVFHLALFANKSGVEVYSDDDAPNVEIDKDGGMCFIIKKQDDSYIQEFHKNEGKFYDNVSSKGKKRKVHK